MKPVQIVILTAIVLWGALASGRIYKKTTAHIAQIEAMTEAVPPGRAYVFHNGAWRPVEVQTSKKKETP